MSGARRALAGAVLVVAGIGAVIAPAAAAPVGKATQRLHGVITIEFPDYDRTGTGTGTGCKADRFATWPS